MKQKSALIVATVSGFIRCFELNDISILLEKGYTVHIATNISANDKAFFQSIDVVLHQINFERFPFKITNFKAIKRIQRIIEDNDISLVHCHTPVGGVIARLAAKKYRKQGCKVIYTAHGLQFYKGAPKKDWLIYYPVEKRLSKCTDAMITINHEDNDIVKEKFRCKAVYYLPGVGVDLGKFGNIKIDRNSNRAELGLCDDDIMLLSVGELIVRKNHQILIRALSRIKNKNIICFIAGSGPLLNDLQDLVNSLGLQDRVFLLGRREDISELLACTDIYVHPAKREGLSVALMEAMASGLPVVCSKIRGNTDLIDDGKGGYLCDVNDINAYANALTRLSDDPDLRHQMSVYNQNKIQEYSINVVDQKMRRIYSKVIQDNN